MSGNVKSIGSRIITLTIFMCRAIHEKDAFSNFRREFIPHMRREENKTNTSKIQRK